MSKGDEFDPDTLIGEDEEEPDLSGYPDVGGEASDEQDPEAFQEDTMDEESYSVDRVMAGQNPEAVTKTGDISVAPAEPAATITKAAQGQPPTSQTDSTAVTSEAKRTHGDGSKKAHLKTLFEQVVEGQPPERAQKFHELKNVMGLRNDDALWGVIAVMDIHLKLFEEIPKSISEASIAATEAAKAQAIQEIQAALSKESEKMSRVVAAGIESRSASLFIEHLTWYGAIVLLYSAFVFSVGYAAGGNVVPPWMRHGMLEGLVNAPLGPVAGATLVASSVFLILRGLTEEDETPGKFGRLRRYAKIAIGFAVAGLGILMI
ncbi:MAG: hypothetical protein ACP5QR_17015 [Rhizomicrobium sp.]